MKGVPGTFSEAEWTALKAAHPGCMLAFLGDCEGRIERGHIVPVARSEKNPSNYIEGIYPICQKHNGSKGQGSKTLDEWLGKGTEAMILRMLGRTSIRPEEAIES